MPHRWWTVFHPCYMSCPIEALQTIGLVCDCTPSGSHHYHVLPQIRLGNFLLKILPTLYCSLWVPTLIKHQRYYGNSKNNVSVGNIAYSSFWRHSCCKKLCRGWQDDVLRLRKGFGVNCQCQQTGGSSHQDLRGAPRKGRHCDPLWKKKKSS